MLLLNLKLLSLPLNKLFETIFAAEEAILRLRNEEEGVRKWGHLSETPCGYVNLRNPHRFFVFFEENIHLKLNDEEEEVASSITDSQFTVVSDKSANLNIEEKKKKRTYLFMKKKKKLMEVKFILIIFYILKWFSLIINRDYHSIFINKND